MDLITGSEALEQGSDASQSNSCRKRRQKIVPTPSEKSAEKDSRPKNVKILAPNWFYHVVHSFISTKHMEYKKMKWTSDPENMVFAPHAWHTIS